MQMKSTSHAMAVLSVIAAGLLCSATAMAREQIQIVGSSTVFPFSTAVAEQFGQKTDFNTPVVESTGSGGGIKLFCQGTGVGTPDITNASRRIKQREFDKCINNGVTPIEVLIGYDGIVLAKSKRGDALSLTREQVFMGLAKNLPIDGKIIPNPHRLWSDIDMSLPAVEILVLGPPPTSGTRDAFVELVMEKACKSIGGIDEDSCHAIREDGVYVEAGENDNLIVQKIESDIRAIGIFGYSFLDQNADKLQAVDIDGVSPSFENIADGDYPISRPLFFYVKKEHSGVIPGLEEYVAEFTSESTWGDDGYLAEKGLIPLPEDQREQIGRQAREMQPLDL